MKDVIMAIALISIVISLKAIHMAREEKKTSRLNAWKVKPELADRFLDVLTNDDYKWMSGHKANEFCPLQDNALLLFIEGATKRIYYTRYFSYPDNLEEEYNITEVTEEWLGYKENKIIAKKGQL